MRAMQYKQGPAAFSCAHGEHTRRPGHSFWAAASLLSAGAPQSGRAAPDAPSLTGVSSRIYCRLECGTMGEELGAASGGFTPTPLRRHSLWACLMLRTLVLLCSEAAWYRLQKYCMRRAWLVQPRKAAIAGPDAGSRVCACSEDQGARAAGQEQERARGSGEALCRRHAALQLAVAHLLAASRRPSFSHALRLHHPQLKDLKTELAALRVAKVTGGAPNKLSKM